MIIILLIAGLTLYGIMVVILILLFRAQLEKALKRLRELQEEALIKESQIKDELERIKQLRAAEVQKGKNEAKRLTDAAKKDAETIASRIEVQAKQDAQKIISFGKEECEKMRQEVFTNIKNQAIRMSLEMIKFTFTDKGRENLQHQLMQELIAEIENIEKEKFTVRTDKISITSSLPLSEAEKKHLADLFTAKFGYHVTIEETIDPDIISGIIIKIGEFVIDGSLKNKLTKAIPYLHMENDMK